VTTTQPPVGKDTPSPPTPDKVDQREVRANRLQLGWWKAAMGQHMTMRLLDGTPLEGILIGYDRYTAALQEPDGSRVLVFKQAIATLRSATRQGEGRNGH
jgi:sRNA-binding regulator protein Hfq